MVHVKTCKKKPDALHTCPAFNLSCDMSENNNVLAQREPVSIYFLLRLLRYLMFNLFFPTKSDQFTVIAAMFVFAVAIFHDSDSA